MCCVSVMELVLDDQAGRALKMTSNEELLQFHSAQLSTASAPPSALSARPTHKRNASDPNRTILKLRAASKELFMNQTKLDATDFEIVEVCAQLYSSCSWWRF
jgi:hypothetical protein